MEPEPTLLCARCGRHLPLGAFVPSARRARCRSTCRECQTAARRKIAQTHVDNGVALEKRCVSCAEIKPASEYHLNLSSASGLAHRCKACALQVYARDRAHKIKKSSEYKKRRCAADPGYRLRARLSSALSIYVRGALVGPRKPFRALAARLGVDEAGFLAHLETSMLPGMTKENYGRAWELDHVRPASSFDHTDPAQVALCWNYKNIRPAFAASNRHKGPHRAPEARPQVP